MHIEGPVELGMGLTWSMLVRIDSKVYTAVSHSRKSVIALMRRKLPKSELPTFAKAMASITDWNSRAADGQED